MLRVLLTLVLLAMWPGQAARGAVTDTPPDPAPPQNQAPQAVSYIYVATLYVGGSSVTINVSSYFSDPDDDPLTYSVNSPNPSIVTVSISGSTVTVAPVAAGSTGKIIVTATDPGGLTATQDFTATVQNSPPPPPPPPPNQAPVAEGSISNVTLEVGGSSTTLNVSSYFTDPDDDPLTYSVNSPNPSVVTVSISGSTVTIAPVAAGSTGKIIVTATDPGGLTATQDFTATVQNSPPPPPPPPPNQAPVAEGSISNVTLEVGGSSTTLNVSSYFTDPDDDPLTYSVNSPNPSVVTVSISGSTVTVAPVAAGSTGKIIVTATDPGGLTATQDFTAKVNGAPVAIGSLSNRTVNAGSSAFTVSVSGKFSDPDGDRLSFSARSSNTSAATVGESSGTLTVTPKTGGTTTITVTASDPGGLSATLSFSVKVNRRPTTTGSLSNRTVNAGSSAFPVSVSGKYTDPDGDSLSFSASSTNTSAATVTESSGTLTVTPKTGGTTTITVTASDPGGLSATLSFSVKVNRRPTTTGSLSNRTVNAGSSAFPVSVSGKYTDPDGDSLSFSASSTNTSAATVTESSGTLTVTPKTGGTTTITVTASDPGGLSATLSFSVKVNRRPTTTGSLSNRTVNAGSSAFPVSVSGKFSDPDGDSLSFSASSTNTSAATVTESSGTLTVTPKTGGTTTITVTASDPGGLSATLSFSVKVNRRPTTTGSLSNRTVNAGSSAFPVSVSGKFSDPDGDSLSFSASSTNTSAATVTESSGTLTVTPKTGGTTTITVTARDPGGLTASLSFTVTVNAPPPTPNRQPVANGSVPDQTANAGADPFTVSVSGEFSDPDDDVLAFSASSSDTSVAEVSESSGTLTVTPKTGGTTTITVTARDPGGLTASLSFTVTVNQSPVVSWAVPDQPLERDGSSKSVILSNRFSDPDGDVLEYSASSSDTSVATVNVSGAMLTVTPGLNGTSTVTVIATDPGGLTASQTLKATVSHAPLTSGTIPKMVLAESDEFRSIDVASYFSDPDGDALVYEVTSSNTDIATASTAGSTVTINRVAPGTGLVWVTAKDPGGLTTLQSMNVQVTNRPPVTETSIANQTLYLTEDFRRVDLVDKFSDPDGDALAFTASSSDTRVATVAAGGSTLQIRPLARGSISVTLRATDPGNRYVEQTFTATVANQYPQTVEPAIGDRTLYLLGGSQKIDATLYFSDPDGDRLTYAVSSPNPETVMVSIVGVEVTLRPVAVGTTGKIIVTARDPGGLAAVQDFNVTVVAGAPPAPTNRPPVAQGTLMVESLYELGPPVVIDVTSYFSDPDDDRLSYTVTHQDPGIVNVSISGSSVQVTPKGPGMTGKIIVTARDSGGLTAVQDFNVAVVAGAPPTQTNRYPVAEGTITVDNLYVEGPSISIDATSYFSDPDDDILAYSVNSPNPGIVEVSKLGVEVTLRPVASGSTGKIIVTARDPGGLTAVQDFNVTVVAGAPPTPTNHAPEIRETLTDQFVTIGGGTMTLNVAPYFHDPDGDPLTYELSAQGAGSATVTLQDSTLTIEPLVLGTTGKNLLRAVDPSGLNVEQEFVVFVVRNLPPDSLKTISAQTLTVAEGSVEMDLSTYFFDPDQDDLTFAAGSSDTNAVTVAVSGDTLTITPVEKDQSSTVTVTASDGELSAEQQVPVTVDNSAPRISDPIPAQTLTVAEGSVEMDLSTYFFDPDQDDLTFAAGSSDTNAVTVAVSGNTLTIAPVEKDMSSTVTVTASDGDLSVQQQFEVTVNNSPPEVADTIQTRTLTVTEGSVELDLSDHFSDADADDVSYTAESSNDGAVTVAVTGDTLTIAPVEKDMASTVTVTASDGELSAEQQVQVTVNNSPPRISDPISAPDDDGRRRIGGAGPVGSLLRLGRGRPDVRGGFVRHQRCDGSN